MINNIDLRLLLKYLKMTGVKFTDLSDRAGMKVSLLYSISAGRSTAKDTEHYLRQVIAASYPSELQRIERLMTLGVLVDD